MDGVDFYPGRIQGVKIKRTNLVHFLFFLVATVICSICVFVPLFPRPQT